ncbi:hypothetical protein ACFLSI_05870 [Bacteroidota bacterium]
MKSTCFKTVPLWLVLLDNIPTLSMYVLGTLIISKSSILFAILYVLYSLLSIVWFWAKICPHCNYHGTSGCPCGYGKISGLLFKKRNSTAFRKIFKRNIIAVYPSWFIPPVFGIYLLLCSYSTGYMVLNVSFALVAFVLIPLISKKVGCKDCAIREDCPWVN